MSTFFAVSSICEVGLLVAQSFNFTAQLSTQYTRNVYPRRYICMPAPETCLVMQLKRFLREHSLTNLREYRIFQAWIA